MLKPPAVAGPRSLSENSQSEIIAAVDLGSNSFHLIVGELRNGQLAIVDRDRETVRLAEGLSPKGELANGARQRALDCLLRFGERLRELHVDRVRVAGTSTMRRVRDDTAFISEAEALLGHRIEVISGIEEARLVYAGVTHSLPPATGLRLVMDIGGGSTEVILGRAAETLAMESLHLGCVSMTERFFPGGAITGAGFDSARKAARSVLQPVKAFIPDATDLEAIGTSGTIRATAQVAQQLKLADNAISLDVVESLIAKVLECDSVDNLSLTGLSERRAQVWPGGLSILAELLDVFGIDEMHVSEGALREGLLYDLI